MPRIISGTAGGIILDTPQGMKTRPTSDRAKEALFSILGNIYCGGAVLDLFSGTGSLGLESLSRGAVSCIFIDQDKKAVDVIKMNTEKCGLYHEVGVLCMDVLKALNSADVLKYKYSCIFMDPPYGKKLLMGTIEKISENDIIKKKGILVVEHSALEVPPKEIAGFVCVDRRKYGTVNFSFYRPTEYFKESGEIS